MKKLVVFMVAIVLILTVPSSAVLDLTITVDTTTGTFGVRGGDYAPGDDTYFALVGDYGGEPWEGPISGGWLNNAPKGSYVLDGARAAGLPIPWSDPSNFHDDLTDGIWGRFGSETAGPTQGGDWLINVDAPDDIDLWILTLYTMDDSLSTATAVDQLSGVPWIYASADGPYFIDVGQTIVLEGGAGCNHEIHGYGWDLNGDRIYDITGKTVEVDYDYLTATLGLAPGVHTIELGVESHGYVEWESTSLTIIPEPATFLLLGLGGLFLHRREIPGNH